jgi:hypothetical protein
VELLSQVSKESGKIFCSPDWREDPPVFYGRSGRKAGTWIKKEPSHPLRKIGTVFMHQKK